MYTYIIYTLMQSLLCFVFIWYGAIWYVTVWYEIYTYLHTLHAKVCVAQLSARKQFRIRRNMCLCLYLVLLTFAFRSLLPSKLLQPLAFMQWALKVGMHMEAGAVLHVSRHYIVPFWARQDVVSVLTTFSNSANACFDPKHPVASQGCKTPSTKPKSSRRSSTAGMSRLESCTGLVLWHEDFVTLTFAQAQEDVPEEPGRGSL